VNPKGGSHLARAAGSKKARYTFSGVDFRTRCKRTVFPIVRSPGWKGVRIRYMMV